MQTIEEIVKTQLHKQNGLGHELILDRPITIKYKIKPHFKIEREINLTQRKHVDINLPWVGND